MNVDNVYFSDTQISTWLHLSSSLLQVFLHCNMYSERIDQKMSFYSNK